MQGSLPRSMEKNRSKKVNKIITLGNKSKLSIVLFPLTLDWNPIYPPEKASWATVELWVNKKNFS